MVIKFTDGTDLERVADTPDEFREMQTGWRKEAYEAQPRKIPCPTPGRNNSMHQHKLGTERLENSLAEMDMGVLIGANQPTKHQFDYEQ